MLPGPAVVTVFVGDVGYATTLRPDELPPAEQARLAAQPHEPTRTLGTATWLAALRLVAARAGTAPREVVLDRRCVHCGDPLHGRPTLPGSSLRLSVTHSGELFAVALADGVEVGIDVERRVRWTPALRDLVLAPGEIPPADPTELWTRKEALLKCTGDGLRTPMAELRLDGPHVRSWAGRPELVDAVRLTDLPVPSGYAGALAVLGEARIDLVVAPPR